MLLICGEGRGVSRGQDGGVAEVVCPPLGWWCVQGACSILCFSPESFFLQALHKWQLGFSFYFLVSLYLCLELAPSAQAQISLRFVAGGDTCPCTSIAAKDLRSQSVS